MVTTRIGFCARPLGVLLLALVTGGGCDGDAPVDAGVDTTADRQRAVLASLGETVIQPAYAGFAAATAALETATADHASAMTPASLDAARAAWRVAMAAWQPSEVALIGPAAESGLTGGAAGAVDIRADIYAWPLRSTCSIDQLIVADQLADPDVLLTTALVSERGLGAMEYLLFNESPDNTCTPVSPINADGTWAAISVDDLASRRARYAATLAILVKRHADALVSAWRVTNGNFQTALATAGNGSTVFSTVQHAMNDLAGALLYLDVKTKGNKVGGPAAIEGCMATDGSCLASLESPYAEVGVTNVVNNLRGFQFVFLGGHPATDAPGIDNLLIDAGAEALSASIATAITTAMDAFDALGTPSLREAIENNLTGVTAAYNSLSVLTRLIKTDLFTVLDLEPSVQITDDD